MLLDVTDRVKLSVEVVEYCVRRAPIRDGYSIHL